MSALATPPQAEYKITVLTGIDQGTVYKVMSNKIRIGREPDNDIILSEDKNCSRHHAVISIEENKITINNVTKKNRILVNGRETSNATIGDNTKIVLGNTEIIFNICDEPNANMLTSPHHGIPPQNIPHHLQNQSSSGKTQSYNPYAPPQQGNVGQISPAFKILVVVIVGFFLYLFFSDPAKEKEEEPGFRTDENITDDIDALEELKANVQKSPKISWNKTVASREAQAAFVRGFRDYRKGQYERAITSFQACKSLNPEHKLCITYLRKAEIQHDQLIEYHMNIGRKYREQAQYRSCASAFKNVMVMKKDPESLVYKEAKANYEACKTYLKGRF